MDNLIGMTFERWRKALKENHYAIEPRYWKRALKLTTMTIMTSAATKSMLKPFEAQIAEATPPTPTFVLGHWRSGTTLLHSILSQDERWGWPTIGDISNPFLFLGLKMNTRPEAENRRKRKRAMDNVEFDPSSPGEDEFALSKLTLKSPLMGWSFTKNEAFYDRFITFRQATPEEVQEWREGFLWFLKALHVKYGKPMLLKSPPHTGRVKLLLKMFPDAKFVAIHRHPYQVYRSTQHFYVKALPFGYLQTPKVGQTQEGILRRYQDMHQAFFEDRALIPSGHLYELAYEDLVQDVVGETEKIYQSLGLDGFNEMLPKLETWINENHRNYQRNPDQPLSDAIKSQIAENWHQSFEEWGYEV